MAASVRIDGVTWGGLVFKNLLRRKARTGLTVAGVAIGVGLIVALLSITAGVKETAKALHLGPGDLLHIGKRAFPIAGVYHSGDRFVDLGAVLPLPVVQSLAQRPHEITTIGVTVKPGSTPKAVAERLERKFPGVRAV